LKVIALLIAFGSEIVLFFNVIRDVYFSARQNAVRTSLGFPGLLLVFVEIMPDKVILDHKKSYLVSFENFHFFSFLAKIAQ